MSINKRFLGYPHRKIRAEIQKRLTGVFAVTVEAQPTGGGTVHGGGQYRYGETATIRAVPSALHNFVKWSDGNTDIQRQVVVKSDRTFVAIFRRQTGKVIFEPNY